MGSSNTGGGGNKDDSAADGGGAADPSASDSPAFNEGERVLAYHGPCLYEATVRVRVQKSESRKDEWRYFVHYLGWSKKQASFGCSRFKYYHLSYVKLPELLAYVNMEEEALAKLQQKLLDFSKFLQKKSELILPFYVRWRIQKRG